MKKLLFILLFPLFTNAQVENVVKAALGEYIPGYLVASGKFYVNSFLSGNYQLPTLIKTGIKECDGMQYQNILMDSSGRVFIVESNNSTSSIPTISQVTTDTTNASFTGNSAVYGFWQSYCTIKNNLIFYGGYGDPLNQNGGSPTSLCRPRQLTQPTGGRLVTKLAILTGQNSPGEGEVMALCSDGTVWKYTRASTTPVQLSFTGVARDITALGAGCYVIETATDLLSCGYLGNYLGGTVLSTVFISIKSFWTSVGCTFPTKKLSGSYNTLAIIDANDHLFCAGDFGAGEGGDGSEYSPWRTYTPVWNYNVPHGLLLHTPVQIQGTWLDIFGNQNYSFYRIGIGAGNMLYTWGRNKARTCPVPDYTTGLCLTYNSSIEGNYSAASIFPAPQKMNIFATTWIIVNTFDINSAKPPVASAGIDQFLTTTTTTLYGSGSSQQEGTISAYLWTIKSGAGNIVNPTAMNPTIIGLSGVTVATLTVTGRNAVQRSRDVTVTTTTPTVTPLYLKWSPRNG